MARKNTQFWLDPATSATSMASSFNGDPFNFEWSDNVGIMLKWAGANPVGSIKLQVSIDYDPRFPASATWAYLQNNGVDIEVDPAGVPGVTFIDVTQCSAFWMRLVYTTADGSVGTLTAKYCAKGLQ